MAKSKKWDFVEVHWEDITGTAEWTGLDNLPQLTVVVHRGWLVYEDDKIIVLAASFAVPDSGDIDKIDMVGDACTIPKSLITKHRRIK